ncbi:SDR family NAD(P)-dependent oxidoreductase [Aquihabitans sp. G128]|nr:SDR family NAD(P)-dependent oxidoreductase [Aquihabitans sp. G128]
MTPCGPSWRPPPTSPCPATASSSRCSPRCPAASPAGTSPPSPLPCGPDPTPPSAWHADGRPPPRPRSPPCPPATAQLAGKVALITGSTSGIGEAIARHYADHGASVLLNSVRSVEAGERIAAELPDALYVQGSIAEPGVPQRLVDAAIERWGRLDVLVNNAGTTRSIPHGDLDAASLEVWREIFETNVFGTWELTRVAVPHLRAAGQRRDDHVVGRRPPHRQLGAVRLVEGGAQPPHPPAGQRPRSRRARQRHRPGPGGHPLDRGLGRHPRRRRRHGPHEAQRHPR